MLLSGIKKTEDGRLSFLNELRARTIELHDLSKSTKLGSRAPARLRLLHLPLTYPYNIQTHHATRLFPFAKILMSDMPICRHDRQCDGSTKQRICHYNSTWPKHTLLHRVARMWKMVNTRMTPSEQHHKQNYDTSLRRQSTLTIGEEVFVTLPPLAALAKKGTETVVQSTYVTIM